MASVVMAPVAVVYIVFLWFQVTSWSSVAMWRLADD